MLLWAGLGPKLWVPNFGVQELVVKSETVGNVEVKSQKLWISLIWFYLKCTSLPCAVTDRQTDKELFFMVGEEETFSEQSKVARKLLASNIMRANAKL